MNAIYKDVVTGERVGYFGGLKDLDDMVIRMVDGKTLREDSLRVLRSAQFASRLGFSGDEEALEVVRTTELRDLPAERIFTELEKLLLGGSVKLGLEVLDSVGALDKLFPELAVLRDTPQDAEWHPEGDVLTHTKMVLDVASGLIEGLSKAEKL